MSENTARAVGYICIAAVFICMFTVIGLSDLQNKGTYKSAEEKYSTCLSSEVRNNTHLDISGEDKNPLDTLKVAQEICRPLRPSDYKEDNK